MLTSTPPSPSTITPDVTGITGAHGRTRTDTRFRTSLSDWRVCHFTTCAKLVGEDGFEPSASCSRSRRSTRLSYTPKREQGMRLAVFGAPGRSRMGHAAHNADMPFYGQQGLSLPCLPVPPRVLDWLRARDLNPNSRIQNPLSCHYRILEPGKGVEPPTRCLQGSRSGL